MHRLCSIYWLWHDARLPSNRHTRHANLADVVNGILLGTTVNEYRA